VSDATKPKRYFPAFLDLERRLAVVVGEGPAAEKRIRQLTRYGADIVVVTAEPGEDLVEAEADGLLSLEPRGYVRGDLAGAFIAVCVSEDPEVRRAVFEEADSIGCLVNVAGEPQFSSFIFPSTISRGALQVAISTGGLAPEAAKALRKQLKEDIGEEWGAWIALLSDVHSLVGERLDDPADRERVLEVAASDATRQRLAIGHSLTAETLMAEVVLARETAEPNDDNVADSKEGDE